MRAVVLSGAGGNFCSGADLKRLIPLYSGARQPEDEWDRRVVEMRKSGRGGFMKDRIVAKPVITAINGIAYAGGCELVLASDIRIASTTAKFALPEISNLGVLPGSGGISRLTRIVGPTWAKWIAMACQTANRHRRSPGRGGHQLPCNSEFRSDAPLTTTRSPAATPERR